MTRTPCPGGLAQTVGTLAQPLGSWHTPWGQWHRDRRAGTPSGMLALPPRDAGTTCRGSATPLGARGTPITASGDTGTLLGSPGKLAHPQEPHQAPPEGSQHVLWGHRHILGTPSPCWGPPYPHQPGPTGATSVTSGLPQAPGSHPLACVLRAPPPLSTHPAPRCHRVPALSPALAQLSCGPA